MHPRSKHCHLIEYIIARQRDDVQITKAIYWLWRSLNISTQKTLDCKTHEVNWCVRLSNTNKTVPDRWACQQAAQPEYQLLTTFRRTGSYLTTLCTRSGWHSSSQTTKLVWWKQQADNIRLKGKHHLHRALLCPYISFQAVSFQKHQGKMYIERTWTSTSVWCMSKWKADWWNSVLCRQDWQQELLKWLEGCVGL